MTITATITENEIAETTVAATCARGRRPSIVISTTPARPVRPTADRTRRRPPLAGLVAQIVAGVTGALLGVAIGLVSAGFDTTRLLLAVGAFALGIGWIVALLSGPDTVPRS